MQAEIKKAGIKKDAHRANDQAAVNKLYLSYNKPSQLSSLKFHIGELLLFVDRSQKLYWPLLDVMLKQYVCLRIAQNGYCCCSDGVGTNKSSQRVVG